MFGGGYSKSGSRHKNWCMARVLSFLIRYFSNYYTLHRSDLAARAAPLDPRLYSLNQVQIHSWPGRLESTLDSAERFQLSYNPDIKSLAKICLSSPENRFSRSPASTLQHWVYKDLRCRQSSKILQHWKLGKRGRFVTFMTFCQDQVPEL